MTAAPIVANEPSAIKQARYIDMCALTGELTARYRKQNTLGISFDWFEPNTGLVIRSENSWTANALVTDTTQKNWLNSSNIVRWVMGVDRPTMIRALNPLRSFFLSAQVFGTHVPDVKSGRFGYTGGDNNNFIFTSFAQTQYMQDQLVALIFGAYGLTGKDATLGGNLEYLVNNHMSLQLGITGFLGARQVHDIGPFSLFTTNTPAGPAGRQSPEPHSVHRDRLRHRSHAGRRLRAQPDGRVLGKGAVPVLAARPKAREVSTPNRPPLETRPRDSRAAGRARKSPRGPTGLAVVALLLGTTYAKLHFAAEAPPSASSRTAVEGGILPAEEDYYAVDVVDADHAWIVGSYGAAILLGERGRKAELPRTCRPRAALLRELPRSVDRRDRRARRPHPPHHRRRAILVAGGPGQREGERPRLRAQPRSPPDLGRGAGGDAAALDGRRRHLGGPVAQQGHDAERGDVRRRSGGMGRRGVRDDTAHRGRGRDVAAGEEITGLPPYVEDVTEEVALRVGIPPLSKEDLYLFDAAFVTPDAGYVVGAGGFVLTTVDRGHHWTAARAGTRNTLFKVLPTPIGGLIATGVLGTVVHHRGEGWVADEEISHRLFTWIRGVGFLGGWGARRRRRRQGRGAPLPRPRRNLGKPAARASRGGLARDALPEDPARAEVTRA